MSRRHWAVLLVVALGGPLVWAGHGLAWSQFHPPFRLPVTYWFQQHSNDLGPELSEQVIHQSVVDWSNVSCTSLRTEYQGPTTRSPRDRDGYNVFGWIHENWTAGSGVIGQTSYRSGGGTSESDIIFNGVHYTWTMESGNSSQRRVNAYSIVGHEIGHFFGLGHSQVRSAMMYASYSGGILSIAQDDADGICALYPGPKTSCEGVTCPPGYACTGAGRCDSTDAPPAEPVPPAETCTPCETGTDCGSSMDYCLIYPDGDKYCSHSCSGHADCAADERCLTVSGAAWRQCVRVVDGEETCKGAPNAEPEPEEPTDPADPSEDPMEPTDPTDEPTIGETDPKPPGDDPKDPGETSLGEPCEINEDCPTGVCLEQGGIALCSNTCSNAHPCPSGFVCDATGGEPLCVDRNLADCVDCHLSGGCKVASRGESPFSPSTVLFFLLTIFILRRAKRAKPRSRRGK